MAWYASKSGNGSAGGAIYLGTGTKFDVSGISGFENLTEANFIVSFSGLPAKDAYISGFQGWSGMGGYVKVAGCTVVKKYDAATGILTISGTGQNVQGYAGDWSHAVSFSQSATVEVYLVLGEIETL